MDKKTEALKLALEWYDSGKEDRQEFETLMRRLLAEQPVIPLGEGNPGLQWDKTPQAFNDWWDSDYDPTGNPFRKDSAAYWAWAGWKAATEQPAQQQEPVAWRTKNATPPGGYVVFQQYPQAVADLNVEIEPLYTSLQPSKPLTDEQMAVLKECRNEAMKWTGQARIPECGAFGGIAQDLDWLCDQLAAEAKAKEQT